MDKQPVRYFIVDIESVSDGDLVRRVKYPDESLSEEEAIAKFRQELIDDNGRDFIPYTYQIPISVVIAKVDAGLQLVDLVSLDEPHFRPHILTRDFWRGWKAYHHPCLVTFNGRSFDLPLLELAAFRYGISIADWFKSDPGHRKRYNLRSHFDLHEVLTNFNATWFRGGLNLAANLIGKPGKMAVQGHMVQDLYAAGQLQAISDYCRCDVLDTYFVFLRTKLMMGELDRHREGELVEHTKQWLVERQSQCAAYEKYLENWGSWHDPWETSPSA
jgi:3'-5' exonuclease